MPKISFDVFQSLASCIAEAELANRTGDNGRSDTLLEAAQVLIEAHGLEGYVGIREIPYDTGPVLRLRGPDGYGISYTIGQSGIIFP